MKKLGRNDACWCGSQKKYKHCHEAFDEKLEEAARAGHFYSVSRYDQDAGAVRGNQGELQD